jgi:hypothetical protein
MSECGSEEGNQPETETKMPKRKTKMKMGTAVRKHVTKEEEYGNKLKRRSFWKTYMEWLDCEAACIKYKLI